MVMTPDELESAMQDIRWTPDILARALECEASLVHAWLDGNAEIPMKTGVWLRVLADTHRTMEETKPKTVKGKGYRT